MTCVGRTLYSACFGTGALRYAGLGSFTIWKVPIVTRPEKGWGSRGGRARQMDPKGEGAGLGYLLVYQYYTNSIIIIHCSYQVVLVFK